MEEEKFAKGTQIEQIRTHFIGVNPYKSAVISVLLNRTQTTRMLQIRTDLSVLIRIISVIGVLYIG